MQEPRRWRELLSVLISDPKEKHRLANALGVHPFTLMHWVYGESSPQPQDLGLLYLSLPQHQQVLAPYITEALEYMMHGDAEIPSGGFYERISRVRVMTPDAIRFWSLCSLILQQALMQLDPHRQGLALRVMRCMPPHANGKICSLREVMGKGTGPWHDDVEPYALLLGKDSFVGAAMIACRTMVVDELDVLNEQHQGWPETTITEASVTIAPIMRHRGIAGCLLVESTRSGYFTPARLLLIQHYTNLLTSMFDPIEFYPIEQLDLQVMPSPEAQRRHQPSYRQRVAALLKEALHRGEHMDIACAEQIVWRQLEEDFLELVK